MNSSENIKASQKKSIHLNMYNCCNSVDESTNIAWYCFSLLVDSADSRFVCLQTDNSVHNKKTITNSRLDI